MRTITHVSTFGQNCGIATYATHVLDGFHDSGDSTITHNKIALRSDIAKTKQSFLQRLKHYLKISVPQSDLLLIQHEFGIWGKSYKESVLFFFLFLLKNFRSSRSVVIVIHTLADRSLDKTTRFPLRYRIVHQFGNWIFGQLLRLSTIYLRCILLVHSTRVATYVQTHYKISAKKILIHPHPFVVETSAHAHVDSEKIAKDALTFKEDILQKSQQKDVVLVGIFGFVNRYKGHEIAVEAIKSLPPNYHLVVLGVTHPENEINPTMDMISRFKVLYPNRITLHCHATDEEAMAFLRICNVLVAPYLPVNLSASGAFTYCLASGVPVIASNIPAFMDIYSEVEAFVKINQGSVEQLAAAILELGTNKFLRERIANNAVRYANANSFQNFSVFLTQILSSRQLLDPAIVNKNI